MTVDWTDYHIQADDNAEDVRAIEFLLTPTRPIIWSRRTSIRVAVLRHPPWSVKVAPITHGI
jgi:hypothetical protein